MFYYLPALGRRERFEGVSPHEGDGVFGICDDVEQSDAGIGKVQTASQFRLLSIDYFFGMTNKGVIQIGLSYHFVLHYRVDRLFNSAKIKNV